VTIALLVARVDDALRLFFRARQDTDLDDFDERREPDAALNALCNALRKREEIDVSIRLDVEAHRILAVEMGDMDLVLARHFGERMQDFLNLAGEEVDALVAGVRRVAAMF